MKVAATVSEALPGIKAVVTDVAMAGDAVLSTADDLIARAQSLTASVTRYFADLDHGSIKVGILHSLSGTLTTSERLAAANSRDDDREAQPGGRAARPSGGSRDHGSALRHRRLCRAGRRLAARARGRRDFRLLDLGLAQARAAGAGEARRAAVLSEPVRRRGTVAACRSIPARRRSSRRCRRWIISSASAAAASSCSAPTTSIRAPPTPSSAIISPRAASAPTRSTSSTRRSARRAGTTSCSASASFAGRDGAIVATLSGDANVHFFRERARQGLDADILPVMSLSLGETEMPALRRAQPQRSHGGVELSAVARDAGEPGLRRRVAAVHRRPARRSPTIRWKRAGSAFSSGRKAWRRPAPPRSARSSARSPAARSARPRVSTCGLMPRPSICTSRPSSAAWTRTIYLAGLAQRRPHRARAVEPLAVGPRRAVAQGGLSSASLVVIPGSLAIARARNDMNYSPRPSIWRSSDRAGRARASPRDRKLACMQGWDNRSVPMNRTASKFHLDSIRR